LWAIPYLPQWVLVATVGVLVGTIAGDRVLFRLDRERFQRVVATVIGLLGLWLIVRGLLLNRTA
jgi:uncharacterized membrane protein YfcA